MSELPNPLTSPDCDLRDFQYMPLDVQRLCDSDLAALESPEACWSALLLWSKAWHQVPAASLPDDDRVLAKFTGYQRAPDAWLAIREGALRGWIKCADGRLYHPVVAEKANEAWFAKHRQAHDKLCERVRKRNKARGESGLVPLEVPELEQWIDMGRPLERALFPSEFSSTSAGITKPSAGATAEFLRKDGEIPPENALKGKGREGRGKGEGEVNQRHSDDGGTPSATDDANADSPPVSGAKYSTLLIRWERERKKLIRCNPAEQTFVEWLNLGLSEEQLRLAYEMAVARREVDNDPSPLNVGLVNSCVQQVLNPPPPKPQREDTSWKRTNPGIERKASELGIYARAGETHDALRERCESEIRKRAQGVAA